MQPSELEAAIEFCRHRIEALRLSDNGVVGLIMNDIAHLELAAQALREKAMAVQGFEEWWEKDNPGFAVMNEHEQRKALRRKYDDFLPCYQAATLASAAKVRELEADLVKANDVDLRTVLAYEAGGHEAEQRIAALEAELAKSQQAAKESFDCFQDAITTRERYRKERDRLAAELADAKDRVEELLDARD